MDTSEVRKQSIRLACDRCHSQKLKCPQNTKLASGGACQRCLRAKVQCTFSPRVRSGRPSVQKDYVEQTSNKRRKKQERVANSSITGSCSSLDDFLDDSGIQLQEALEYRRNEPYLRQCSSFVPASTSQGTTNAVSTPNFDLNPLNLTNETDEGPLSFEDVDINMDEVVLDDRSSAWDVLQEQDIQVLASQDTCTVIPNLDDREQLYKKSISMSSTYDEYTDDGCTRRFSALAVGFHRHLEALNHGLWAKSNLHQKDQFCLRNYPIGDILHLSQEFIDALQALCSNYGHNHTTSDNAEDESYITEHSIDPKESSRNTSHGPDSSAQSEVDTPTALLILNCYVSMIRIYSVLFAHLDSYLHFAPSHPNPRVDSLLHQPLPGLQFGELPLSDEAYARAHTAFRMLLDALQRSEEALGLPKDLRCIRCRQAENEGDGGLFSTHGATHDSSCSDDGSSSSNNNSLICVVALADTEPKTRRCLVGAELARAVFRQETFIGASNGGGGLSLLRHNIRGVKKALRQKMGL